MSANAFRCDHCMGDGRRAVLGEATPVQPTAFVSPYGIETRWGWSPKPGWVPIVEEET